jgi:hypothetical protein
LSLTTPKPEKRKSCLRNSNRFLADDLEELSKTAPVIKKRSSFLNIKSIDGEYHHKKENSESDDEAINVKV